MWVLIFVLVSISELLWLFYGQVEDSTVEDLSPT